MKKFIIALAVGALALTGLSTAASATGGEYERQPINIDCSTKIYKLYIPHIRDAEDVAELATGLYADAFEGLTTAAGDDGIIDSPFGDLTLTTTGDATGGTISLTDEGQPVLTASLTDGEFSFEASVEFTDFLEINVSFYKDRLGNLCGTEPFTVCISNTVFLVEAADLAEYLETNPTAVVINSSVGCPGKPGADGTDGSDGSDGAAGAAGPAGPAGQTVVVEKIVQVPVAAPVQLPRTS